MRTRVKICGITRIEDAQAAIGAGADALGFVFYEPSSRFVELEAARNIAASLSPLVTLVGLFVNAKPEVIERVLDMVPIQLLQFHGNESAEFCQQFNRPYIKAFRVGTELADGALSGERLSQEMAAHSGAQGLLLDSFRKGMAGGTGTGFDWSLIPAMNKPLLLAGGLQPENVADAISQVRPFAVDVSGGVESAPGLKDAGRIRAFFEQVRLADRHIHEEY